MKRRSILGGLLAALLIAGGLLARKKRQRMGKPMPAGRIFWLDRENGDDANDGLSPENAVLNYQRAIDLASSGDAQIIQEVTAL